ncbi:malto-oligosyltrehalose synthase [Aciditerrimonas ferrireducens]|uniref:malto-oligosyltrehalose synthase n=1 Tax=Aciditerrimonas ferrireducens TaxID=667306 RepID=UPI0020046600|nr:malto-oligosyltrehalose synthase [Aciditerrimonas ferrireducens]MCK4177530.1 malto-oligosyltrehalose synthase [Aciditerrimonas ferrireducens]
MSARRPVPGPEPRPARWLGSTYRLQLRPPDLEGARTLLPELARLGISTLYLSPIARALPGSRHGYDVADPSEVDPAIGGFAAWERLAEAAEALGMGLLVDSVPNHQAAHEENPWWADLLRHGRRSPHARAFDVDWAAHKGRVLLPILAVPFADALAEGSLRVAVARRRGEPRGLRPGEPVVVVSDRRLPIGPGTWEDLAPDPPSLARRCSASRRGRALLAELLDRQAWRLAWWRTAPAAAGYRRFFDVDGLVGVRVEDPEVFAATHRLLARLAEAPAFAGVRVDHLDGLADPVAYLGRLQALLAGAGAGRAERPVVLVEKILADDEVLVAGPADGTTGYEVTARLLRTLAPSDPPAADVGSLARQGRLVVLDELFPGELRRLAGRMGHQLARSTAGHDLTEEDVLAGLRALTAGLDRYRTLLRPGEPPGPADRAALLRAAQVARDLVSQEAGPSAPLARSDPARLLKVLVDFLLAVPPAGGGAEADPGLAGSIGWGPLVARWQQLASAVAAKGVEDTALYRLPGPRADADVGDQPGAGPLSSAELAGWLAERQRWAPEGLCPLATHDAKWSGDARARLATLDHPSSGFERAVARWQRRHRRLLGGQPGLDAPSLADELRLYRSLAALWPPGGLAATPDPAGTREALAGRLGGMLEKAAREAKERTSWTDPDPTYEAGLRRWVEELVLGPPSGRFLAELERLLARVGPAAAALGLGLVGLAHLAPGIPDTYQGSEGWLLVGVDPDNREPLDPAALAARLAVALGEPLEALVERWWTGALKIRVVHELLELRRARPALFRHGAVSAPRVQGPEAERVVTLARQDRETTALLLTVRPDPGRVRPGRLPAGAELAPSATVVLPRGWPGRFRELLGGHEVRARAGRLSVADVLGAVPLGVLVGV